MDNVSEILSKFKSNLDNIIVECNDRVSDIESEEDFIRTLGDLVNYSKSDSLLLPFYDETILSRVFERVFPLSSTESNKLKSAKYLIESCKDIDTSNFPQYNDSIKDIGEINDKISKYYEKMLSDDSLKNDKNECLIKIDNYSKIVSYIGDDGFTCLIDDIDLFQDAINSCDLSLNDINIILNVAIRDNLKFLDSTGSMVVDDSSDIAEMKEENNKFIDEISNLSNLLEDE